MGFSMYTVRNLPDYGKIRKSCRSKVRVLMSGHRKFRTYGRVLYNLSDRLCGLVVRVSGYRYRGLGFDSRRYQIF